MWVRYIQPPSTVPETTPAQIVNELIDYVRERKTKEELLSNTGHTSLITLITALKDNEIERERLKFFLTNRNKLHFFSKQTAKMNFRNNAKRGCMMATSNYLIATTFLLFPPIPIIMFGVGGTIGFITKQVKHQVHVHHRAKELLAMLNSTYPDECLGGLVTPENITPRSR